jgi:hypothetical protein
MISLNVLYASVAFWNASKFFFNATISFVFLSIAFHTIPYAPLPIHIVNIEKFSLMINYGIKYCGVLIVLNIKMMLIIT